MDPAGSGLGSAVSAACRPACGACCIAPSISPSWPALPDGKRAGDRCPHLLADITCALFGKPERPRVCSGLRPSHEMCGDSASDAMAMLIRWETLTAPRSRS
ncbi:MAG: YkgJ family cysteine cluster protein [Deltaproteobacteria bacterium]|nr:YkgJ family cysteine cluster protein [Deltaproteobacteria bacterium]MDQ3295836.1 YkgJ family cysteine cluster protein [Myxococcota bacterium]